MEIEAKFSVPDVETFHRLRATQQLAGYPLSAGQTKQVQDTYLDTQDRAILAAGYACRWREGREGTLITLKGLGGAEGAIHRREELEIQIPAYQPPEEWPAGPARDKVLGLIGEAPLYPLFELQQVRFERMVSQDERPIAELSLDGVHLAAGDRELSFFELEVELAPQGTEEDLAAIVACLQEEWKLEPETRSKFERALAFLEAAPASRENGLLTSQERAILRQISSERDDLYGRRAIALLALDEGTTQVDAGERAGLSARQVRRWLSEFRRQRLGIFPRHILDEVQPEPAPLPVAQEPLPTPEEPPQPLPLDDLFERYHINRSHARHVADHALALFDHLSLFHGLPPERRSLLETAALVHDVGLETDLDRHHIAGRDILLAHPPAGLDDHERLMVALITFLHRKRITRKKLNKLARTSFDDLDERARNETLAMAALLRLADGLDYSQTASSRLGQVRQSDAIVEIEVDGPFASVDAKRAQKKSDLWHMLFEADLKLKPIPTERIEGLMHQLETPRIKIPQKPPKSPGLEPDDSMAEAARKTFYLHFQRMLYHEPGTRHGEDIEELHDMRVATRRMRAAYQVFGDYLDMEHMAPFFKGLRRTGRVLGAVRDLDVFWEKTQHYLDTLPPEQPHDLEPLRTVWEAEREVARERMVAYLDSKRYARFTEEFGEFLQTPGAGALPVLSQDGEPIPHRLRHVVPVAVYQRLAAVWAYDEWVTGPDVPMGRLHQLRIAAKGLRYTLEYFREVLGPEAETVIDEVKALQDHLGDLQDAVVASNLLRDFLTWGTWGHKQTEDRKSFLPIEPVVAPGVAVYLAARQTELQRLLGTFPQVWSRFHRPEFSQLVTSALSPLFTGNHSFMSTIIHEGEDMTTEPKYIVLLGPPASGKGTQAAQLRQALNLPHVASGDLFRENLKNETELGLKAKAYMDRGELVPDDVTIAMVMDRLSQPDCADGALLDGFPRTMAQAEALDQALAAEGHKIGMVPNIVVPDEILVERVAGRRICRLCGEAYHVKFNPPQQPGVCDNDAGELYQRDDDKPETVRQRLKVYWEQTSPLIDYFRKQGVLVEIDGDQAIESVQADLRAAVADV
jgi:adenylate kinase